MLMMQVLVVLMVLILRSRRSIAAIRLRSQTRTPARNRSKPPHRPPADSHHRREATLRGRPGPRVPLS